MTLTRKLASVVCSALLCLSYSACNAQNVTTSGALDPSQIYSTGDIVQPTVSGSNTTPWVNGVYQNNLTCWAWGDPGYCGPNAIVRPGNNINFSFGTTNLYQMQAIASVLPDSGSGLRVNGFNFGFTAKNGNGWDNGSQDYLGAYVNFYGVTGNLAEAYDYTKYTNQQYNWKTFNFSETFITPYASKDLASVQYGFVGRDNNGWAGPYGPEVYNVNFSLKYSVDVCSIDPTSSPTCPGYYDAIKKYTTAPPPPELAPPPQTLAGLPPPPPPGTEPQQAPPPPLALPPPPLAPAPMGTVTPSASNPQPKVGEISIAGSSQSKSSGPSLNSILNMVSSEQNRISKVEQTVVQQAVSEAKAAGDKATQDAESVAGSLTSQSITSSMAMSSSGGGTSSVSAQQSRSNSLTQPSNTSVINIAAVRQPQNEQSSSTVSSASMGITTTQSFRPAPLEISTASTGFVLDMNKPPQTQMYTPPAVSYSIEPRPQQAYVAPMPKFEASTSGSLVVPNFDIATPNVVKQAEVELPKTEGIRMGSRSVLNDYMETKTLVMLQQTTTQTSSVNQKASDNDASAGGATIAMIAKMPAGYELYSVGIKDAAFYAPKEIYKNQNVVDNARALRQMSSDRLHQQLIDLQYKDN